MFVCVWWLVCIFCLVTGYYIYNIMYMLLVSLFCLFRTFSYAAFITLRHTLVLTDIIHMQINWSYYVFILLLLKLSPIIRHNHAGTTGGHVITSCACIIYITYMEKMHSSYSYVWPKRKTDVIMFIFVIKVCFYEKQKEKEEFKKI